MTGRPKQMCPTCHGMFQPRSGTSRYCSRHCASIGRRNPDRPCGTCGTLFWPRVPGRQYCSRVCAHKAARSIRAELVCPTCGQTFQPTKADTKFCSKACYDGQTTPADDRAVAYHTGAADARNRRPLDAGRATHSQVGESYRRGYDDQLAKAVPA